MAGAVIILFGVIVASSLALCYFKCYKGRNCECEAYKV